MTDSPAPATWQQFAVAAPELATTVRAGFGAAKHHVLATLRRDGSPRVSGTEVQFHGPDVVVGMMHGSAKARDLQRDGRFALHANPGDGSMTGGDAKVAGEAREVTDAAMLRDYADAVEPPPPFHLFRLLLTQVVVTSVQDDRLVVVTWHRDRGIRRTERA